MPGPIIKVLNSYDESLNQAFTTNYNLSIQCSRDGLSFTLFNDVNSKFLSIESIETEFIKNNTEFSENLLSFFKGHNWLGKKFKNVLILIETTNSTLIPASLFSKPDAELLAHFNFQPDKDEVLKYDYLKSSDAYLLYTLPESLESMLANFFGKCTFKSHASTLIELIMILNKNQPSEKRMFVNVRKRYLDIVIAEGKQLIFYNSFSYFSKEDFIYYIIFVIEQLNLNPEEIDLKFSGIIDKQSTLFDIAWKYVRNIQFQRLSDSYKYSYIFNEIPGHYFFTLINNGLCE